MFRATLCSSPGGQILLIQHLVSSLSVSACPVCRLRRKFLLDLHTGRPPTEGDYTRCCIDTIDILMMSTTLLETCRGLWQTNYRIKEMCVKLVIYQRPSHKVHLSVLYGAWRLPGHYEARVVHSIVSYGSGLLRYSALLLGKGFPILRSTVVPLHSRINGSKQNTRHRCLAHLRNAGINAPKCSASHSNNISVAQCLIFSLYLC